MAVDPPWTEVTVTVDPERAELAADVLWRCRPAAVEERPVGRAVSVRAGFADPDSARRAAADLAGLAPGAVSVRTIGGDEIERSLDAWRAWARPVVAGPFRVVPTWLADHDDHDGAAISLLVDPGPTFGSGSHPTTRLVLARIAALVQRGHRVLDVGCGSGILSVGAALVGAGSVTAIDIDPGAPDATRANAAANGVADRIDATTDPLPVVATAVAGGEPPYDVVVANLLAPTIAELAADLGRALAPTGALVLSGLLEDAWEPSAAAVVTRSSDRLAVVDVAVEEGWAAVTLATPTGGDRGVA